MAAHSANVQRDVLRYGETAPLTDATQIHTARMDTTIKKRTLTDVQKSAQADRCRRWAAANRFKRNEYVRAYRARRYAAEGCWREEGKKAKALKMWMIEIKSKPCADCSRTFPSCCMDFDHREGSIKKYNIGSMFAHHYSVELIKTELEKCDLVCSNCHRLRTRDRRTGSGKHRQAIPPT